MFKIILKNKGQLSIEFIISILLLLIIINLFIIVNLRLKEKLEDNVNFNNYNKDICLLKENYLNLNCGEIINDPCTNKEQKSTNNVN